MGKKPKAWKKYDDWARKVTMKSGADVYDQITAKTRNRFSGDTQKALDKAITQLGLNLRTKGAPVAPGTFLDLVAGSLGYRRTPRMGLTDAKDVLSLRVLPKTYLAFAFAFENILFVQEARGVIDPYVPYGSLDSIIRGPNQLTVEFTTDEGTGNLPKALTLKQIDDAELERFSRTLSEASGVPLTSGSPPARGGSDKDKPPSFQDSLFKLAEMRQDGLLTEEEFRTAKERLFKAEGPSA